MADAGTPVSESGPPVSDADKPLCDLSKEHRDDDGCVPSALLQKLDLTKCRLEKDTCFSFEEAEPKQPPRQKAVEPVVAPPLKESPVEPKEELVAPPVLLASNDAPTHAQEAAPAAPQTVETVGVDQAVQQMKALMPAGKDVSPAVMVGGAAVLAVVGAAVKLGPGALKAWQSAKMKKLEIEEKKAEQSEEGHQQCTAQRALLEAKVSEQASQLSALSAKLSEVERKASEKPASLDLGDFDPEEMQDRLEALEKALKKASAPEKKKPGRPKK